MTARAGSLRAARRPGAGLLVRLSLHQFRFDLRAFFRNRQSRFFTLVLPVLFLVIFASVFHGSTVKVAGGTINTSVYYVPGIITLGIIAAAFANLVISVTAQRETGALKRRRATPVPAAAIIAGRALTSVVVALGITALLLAIGWLFYRAAVPGRTAPALAVTVIVGALAFCCLGFALASVIRNSDSAQPDVAPLLHFRRVHRGFDAAALAGRRRRRFPRPAPGRSAADGLQPAHDRRRPGRHRPARGRVVGCRGASDRAVEVRLGAAQPLSRQRTDSTREGGHG